MSEKLKEILATDKSRTELGRRLREIRDRIVSSGELLFDWNDLEKELAERRGDTREKDEEKANLH